MAFNYCWDWSSKLPDELTIEILCRLPEKPRIQFKSVDVPCYMFQLLYGIWSIRSLENPPDRGRFVEPYSKLLPFQPTGRDVLDCCNGLLLILRRSSVPPSSVAIPVNPNHLDPIYAVLAFNPVIESPPPPNNTNTNNYKIVRFSRPAGTASASVTQQLELNVFSSVTSKWVNHLVPLQPELEPEFYGFKWVCKSVYLDGVLYMLSYAMYLLCLDLNVDNLNPQAVKLPGQGSSSWIHCGVYSYIQNVSLDGEEQSAQRQK
ncbi:unnamed protein product [Camellia sinensis]